MKYKHFLVPIPVFLLSVWYFATIAFNDIPFWYKGMSDPSYLYLESTLHVARGEFPVHVDNPGTPVQYIGAITFRLTHLLTGKGDFTEDVLTRSEYYLRVLRFVLLFIAAVSIWVGGFWAFKITESYFAVFLVQIAPFLTASILGYLHRFQTICPETFFIPLGIVWLLFLFYLEKQAFTLSKTKDIFFWAVLSAVMVATKLTLLPFILFPLFIKATIRNKFLYVGIFLLSFVVFTFFQLFSSEKLFLWTRDLFFSSGAYGTGAKTIINIQDFVNNAISLASNDILLAISFLVNTFLLLSLDKKNFYFGVARAIWVVELVYWIMLSKHYVHGYYVYGALFLVAGSFWLLYRIFFSTKQKLLVTIVILGIVGFSSFNHFLIFANNQQLTAQQQNEMKQVQNFYEKYPKKYFITSYEAISLPYALSYGLLNFTPDLKSLLGKYLKNKYPYAIFERSGRYTLWGEDIHLDSLMKQQDTIIWHTGFYETEIKYFENFKLIDSLKTISGNKLCVFSKSQF